MKSQAEGKTKGSHSELKRIKPVLNSLGDWQVHEGIKIEFVTSKDSFHWLLLLSGSWVWRGSNSNGWQVEVIVKFDNDTEYINIGRGVLRWLLRVGWPRLVGLHGLGFVKFRGQHPPRPLASQGPFSRLLMVKNTWEKEQPTPERLQIHCLLKSQQLPNEMAAPINYAKHSCEDGHQSHHLPLLDFTLDPWTSNCIHKWVASQTKHASWEISFPELAL